jgi:hypothetical protein
LCSCGLDEGGLVQSSNDASVDNVVDSADEQPQKEAGPPQACSVDAGSCVASLPSGWALVAFDPSNENACPSNFASANVVMNVLAEPTACDCGCNVTTNPACDVGSLQRYISADTSCSQTGQVFAVNGGGCNVLQTTGGLSAYSKSSALAPSGGACTGNVVKNKSGIAFANGATCTVPDACAEQFCGGDVPGGFESCIQTSGEQACPAGWSTPVFVGDDFDFDCSACTCDVQGTTCTNATLTFYSDTKCTASIAALAVDGTCAADPAAGQSPLAWTYTATVTPKCNAAGAKTASNVKLTNERTICCK